MSSAIFLVKFSAVFSPRTGSTPKRLRAPAFLNNAPIGAGDSRCGAEQRESKAMTTSFLYHFYQCRERRFMRDGSSFSDAKSCWAPIQREWVEQFEWFISWRARRLHFKSGSEAKCIVRNQDRKTLPCNISKPGRCIETLTAEPSAAAHPEGEFSIESAFRADRPLRTIRN